MSSLSILYIKNCVFKDNLSNYPKINYTDNIDSTLIFSQNINSEFLNLTDYNEFLLIYLNDLYLNDG